MSPGRSAQSRPIPARARHDLSGARRRRARLSRCARYRPGRTHRPQHGRQDRDDPGPAGPRARALARRRRHRSYSVAERPSSDPRSTPGADARLPRHARRGGRRARAFPFPNPRSASSCSRTSSTETAAACAGASDLDAIAEALPDLIGFPSITPGAVYRGPTLFLRGERSEYLTVRHEARICALFPSASIDTITGAGHWLHAERPAAVTDRIVRFHRRIGGRLNHVRYRFRARKQRGHGLADIVPDQHLTLDRIQPDPLPRKPAGGPAPRSRRESPADNPDVAAFADHRFRSRITASKLVNAERRFSMI